MLLQMALFHSFLWLSNIPLYIYHIFIHSSVSGHLGCFHVLAIVNMAAMNIEVHVSFEWWFSLGICPGVGLLGHMVIPFLLFWGAAILFSIVAAQTYIPTNSVGGFLFQMDSLEEMDKFLERWIIFSFFKFICCFPLCDSNAIHQLPWTNSNSSPTTFNGRDEDGRDE